ncbi:MAG: hypothetical protein LIO42_03605 [Oscillospiraceae bacterium]|nr:hypothetical protein [Oscillospiraceae bacterium]
MKNLYQYLAPFLADTFGFQEVIDVTDGMGILEDCSPYKGMVSRADPNAEYGSSRLVSSNIRMEDVIGGTKDRLLQTFRANVGRYDPAFVLVGNAPVALMIGTDLEDVAASITAESGIPAAAVELGGHKYYDSGLSAALLALAKLLVRPSEEKIQSGINLLGGNAIDFAQHNVQGIRQWAEEQGFFVVSQWGGPEKAENLKRAGMAQVNLVTAASGLSAARWMEKQLGIPYVSAAPFGASWSAQVAAALRQGKQPDYTPSGGPSQVLLLGEQLTCSAIRATLELDFGVTGVAVASFFTMDKALAVPGDQRLKSESALQKLLADSSWRLALGDPELNEFSTAPPWVPLSHGAVGFEGSIPPLVGAQLNRWLENALPKEE